VQRRIGEKSKGGTFFTFSAGQRMRHKVRMTFVGMRELTDFAKINTSHPPPASYIKHPHTHNKPSNYFKKSKNELAQINAPLFQGGRLICNQINIVSIQVSTFLLHN